MNLSIVKNYKNNELLAKFFLLNDSSFDFKTFLPRESSKL